LEGWPFDPDAPDVSGKEEDFDLRLTPTVAIESP
jgi:hypothetical protein